MLAHGIIDSRRKKKVADQGKAKSTAQSVEREGCIAVVLLLVGSGYRCWLFVR